MRAVLLNISRPSAQQDATRLGQVRDALRGGLGASTVIGMGLDEQPAELLLDRPPRRADALAAHPGTALGVRGPRAGPVAVAPGLLAMAVGAGEAEHVEGPL